MTTVNYRAVALRALVLVIAIICEVSALQIWDIYATLVMSFRVTEVYEVFWQQRLGPKVDTAHMTAIVLALSGSLLGWADAAKRPRVIGILIGIVGLLVAVKTAALV